MSRKIFRKLFLPSAVSLSALFFCSCASPVRKAEFKYPDKDSAASFERVCGKLGEEFRRIDEKLSSAASALEKTNMEGEGPRAILGSVVTGSKCIVSCCVINEMGFVRMAEPSAYQSLEGKSFSSQQHIKSALSGGKPVMSGIFKSEEGFESVVFVYPLKGADGRVSGAVTALIKPDSFLAALIIPEIETNPLNIWVVQTDGTILYDRDPGEVGKNIFDDKYFKSYSELRGLTRRICNETRGSGNYLYPTKGAKLMIEKHARWNTVGLYGRAWRVVMNLEDTSE